MANIDSLNKKLNQYVVLKDNLNRAVSQLVKSIDMLEPATKRIAEFYTIDDLRADSNHLANCNDIMNNNRSNLSSLIVPAIDREISRIKRELERLENENVA